MGLGDLPEYLNSLDRTPKAMNILPYVPVGPMLLEVLGVDDAKAGRMPTDAEHEKLANLLREAMDAGGCGWSAQRLPPPVQQRCNATGTERRCLPT